jgi:hypothetical protein
MSFLDGILSLERLKNYERRDIMKYRVRLLPSTTRGLLRRSIVGIIGSKTLKHAVGAANTHAGCNRHDLLARFSDGWPEE